MTEPAGTAQAPASNPTSTPAPSSPLANLAANGGESAAANFAPNAENNAPPAPNGAEVAKQGDTPASAPPAPIEYVFTPSEVMAKVVDPENDPVIGALREVAKAENLTAEQFDMVAKVVNGLGEKLAKDGLVATAEDRAAGQYDWAREFAGVDNAQGRFDDAVVDVEARRVRGELSEDEASELAALVGTKSGLAVYEKLIKAGAKPMEKPIEPPKDTATTGGHDRVAELVRDARYNKDNAYTRQANREIRALGYQV